MIFDSVPESVEILPTGFSQVQPDKRKPLHVEWYTELLGGLGDALLRIYSHKHCYESLSRISANQKAAVVLMCHNPALVELFKWHPMNISGQLSVYDLGFKTQFHPWENREWRLAHGLPEKSPCPMGGPVNNIEFHGSLYDMQVVQSMQKADPYIILHPSAGQPDRDIPPATCQKVVERCKKSGFNVFVLGHSKYVRSWEFFGAESMVDKLTVPGMIVATRGASGVVTSHTSITHVAWCEQCPVFLMYPQWVKDAYVSRGAEGYMAGINRADTDHMLLGEFNEERFEKWLHVITMRRQIR